MEDKKNQKERDEARKEIDSALALKVVNLRKMRGLTLEQFAWNIGVSQPHISRCELGERTFSLEIVWLMAQYYNIEIEFFLNPNLTFDDWFDESRRNALGIRRFSDTPAPYVIYEVPLKY